jgi:DUF1680 family protein
MKIHKLFILFLLTLTNGQAQDQILDGIGETDMVARYIFNENTKDWSRNSHHDVYGGIDVPFVNDSRFGKVLSLFGEQNSFLTIPKEAFSNLESISISAWVQPQALQTGQYLFDLRTENGIRFFTNIHQEGVQSSMVSKSTQLSGKVSTPLKLNTWIHIVLVIDLPSKSMTTYMDNKVVDEVSLNTGFSLENTTFYIGKSIIPNQPNLKALIHDLRIYRVPLSRKQVAGIFYNANGNQPSTVNVRKTEDNLPQFEKPHSLLYNAHLLSVSDVEVETVLGELPKLPSHVKAVYKNGIKKNTVQVIWPAPTDNRSVLEPGKYTITGQIPGTDFEPKVLVTVTNKHTSDTPIAKLEAFKLSEVSLDHDSRFLENQNKFVTTLAKTDPNSFLYMFRHAFGQKQPEGAKPLEVWDSQGTKLRGHATGHYLTAIAQAYAGSSHDKSLQANFATKMEYTVQTLHALSQLSGKPKENSTDHVKDPTQVPVGPNKTSYDSDLSTEGIRTDYWNWGTGYISAYPPDQFIMLENGAKYGSQKNQVWAPYYTLHKILSGLMDVYEVSGNKKALEVATGMSDWVHARLSQLPQDTLIKIWNTYIAGEFGGMNESMARLYRITQDEKYLKTAHLFDNIKMFFGDAGHSHGLAKNVDTFRGLHANQHIPQVVGSIEMYRMSQDPAYYKIADNFWHKAVNDYMYSIGGVAGARNPANAECFLSQPSTIYENGLSAGGQNETCATYNMLKLTGNLFLYDPKAERMDYYERALYNHILASVAENSPANTYHVSLRPASIKQFGNPNMTGFTCCNGTAIESSTKLQNSIYFKSKDNSALYVNLFIPSTLQWTERNVTLQQRTRFPKEDYTQLTIGGNGQFDIHVRVPGWATAGYIVKINGKTQKLKAAAGSYLKLSRNWKNGDVIELKMPFQFRLEPVMDQQNIASLFYGPVLLAAQESEARNDWRQITVDAKDINKFIKGDPKKLEFTVNDVIFKPFYDTYGRHSVYLDVTLK